MASLKLTQTKRSDGLVYAVQNVVTEQTNPLLDYPFIITAAGQAEAFLRVCTRDEAIDSLYIYNPLDKFFDGAVDVGAVALAGDVLRVYAPPVAWDDTGDDSIDFLVAGVDGSSRLVMDASTYFPAATAGLTWELIRGDASIINGLAGSTQRDDPNQVEFFDYQFTTVFADANSALQSMALIKSELDTLVGEMNSNPNTFRDTAPGNPVIITIPES